MKTPSHHFCISILKQAGLLPATEEEQAENYKLLPANDAYVVALHPMLLNLLQAGNLNQTTYQSAIDFLSDSNKKEMANCAAFLAEHGLMTDELAAANNRALIAKFHFDVSYLFCIAQHLQMVGILNQDNIQFITLLGINSQFDFNAFSRMIVNLKVLKLLNQQSYTEICGIMMGSKVPAGLVSLILLNPSSLKHKLSPQYYARFTRCAAEIDYNLRTEKTKKNDSFIWVMKMLLGIKALHPKSYKLIIQNAEYIDALAYAFNRLNRFNALNAAFANAILENGQYAEGLARGICYMAAITQTTLLDKYYKFIIANPERAELLGAGIAALSAKDLLENRGRHLLNDPHIGSYLCFIFVVMDRINILTATTADSIIYKKGSIMSIYNGIKILDDAQIENPESYRLMIIDESNTIANASRIVQTHAHESMNNNFANSSRFFATTGNKRPAGTEIKKEEDNDEKEDADNKRVKRIKTP